MISATAASKEPIIFHERQHSTLAMDIEWVDTENLTDLKTLPIRRARPTPARDALLRY